MEIFTKISSKIEFREIINQKDIKNLCDLDFCEFFLKPFLCNNMNENLFDQAFIEQRICIARRAVSSSSPLLKFNTLKIATVWSWPCRAKKIASPARHPQPACPAYLVHAGPTLHFFIRYSCICHFFQNGVTRVFDVDCHSMLYLFYSCNAVSIVRQVQSHVSILCILDN